MMINEVEEAIRGLQPGQAIHLGHSSIIGNFNGVRLGFDLSTIDGMVLAPFSNLTLSDTQTIPHLLPLIDQKSSIPRPKEIACELDILLFSHLHPDHFSLRLISQIKRANNRIRVICPVGSKSYLLQRFEDIHKKNRLRSLVDKLITRYLFCTHQHGVEKFHYELQNCYEERFELIDTFEEIDPSQDMRVCSQNGYIDISSFYTIHPSSQYYIKAPFENEPPPTLGYCLRSLDQSAIIVGETALDPASIKRIFLERDRLSIVFYPITEQCNPKRIKLLEELIAHSSLKTFILLERIVKHNTKLIPLHQGLWYFQVKPADFINARIALINSSNPNTSSLPFVSLTRQILSIRMCDKPMHGITTIIRTSINRWKSFRKLAAVSHSLPIMGKIDGLHVGKVIDFSVSPAIASSQITNDSIEGIKSAIQVHLTEYEALRSEINNAWEWQKTLIQYSLLVIATTITLASTFSNLEILFIAASFILSLLGWSYIEQSMRMLNIGRYYKQFLTPRVNNLLIEMNRIYPGDPSASDYQVFGWEDFLRSGKIYTALLGVASMGKYSFAVFPGIISALVYFYIRSGSLIEWTQIEVILFYAAIGLSLLPLFTALYNISFAYRGGIN